jgi:hypothetical protein
MFLRCQRVGIDPHQDSPQRIGLKMSDQPAPKRARANTDGESIAAPGSADSLRVSVDALSEKDVRELLLAAALVNPSIAQQITAKHNALILLERRRVFTFDSGSGRVWYAINKKWSHLSGSDTYDQGFEVVRDVQRDIRLISNCVRAHSSWDTKKNAMEVLRKIGKTIAISPGQMASEVRKGFQHESMFEDAMGHIVDCMTEEERVWMCNEVRLINLIRNLDLIPCRTMVGVRLSIR